MGHPGGTRRRLVRLGVAVLAGLTTGLFGVGGEPATGQGARRPGPSWPGRHLEVLPGLGSPPAAAPASGYLRVAHLSPDTPPLDVTVRADGATPGGSAPGGSAPGGSAPGGAEGRDGATAPDATGDRGGAEGPATVAPGTTAGLRYGTIAGYAALPVGSYTVSVRTAGAPPAGPPTLAVRVSVTSGHAATVAAVGRRTDLDLRTIADDLTAPPPGQAKIRLLAASLRWPVLDLRVDGGPDLATGAPFATAGRYQPVAPGRLTLRIGAAGTQDAVTSTVSTVAGRVYSLVVVDDPGGVPRGLLHTDAVGVAEVPAGGVPAGGAPAGGGSSTGGGHGEYPVALILGAALLLGGAVPLAMLGVRRHRGGLRAPETGATLAVAALTVVVAVTALGAGGLVTAGSRGGGGPARSDGSGGRALPARPAPPGQTAGPATVGAPTAGAAAGSASPAGTGEPPVRLRVPAIGVDAPLAVLRADRSGVLSPPADSGTAGWYAGGPLPGETGPAVIAGHVDSWAGAAVFARLTGLTAGDQVLVLRDGRWLGFRVVAVARYPKEELPSGEVYGPTPDAQLRLITCGGPFDRERRSYLDNVVVSAVAAG